MINRLKTFGGAIFTRRLFSTVPIKSDSKFKYPIWKSLSVFLITGGGNMMNMGGTVGTPLIGCPFNLIDTENRSYSNQDLLGKYYLLYFGFTHCPDICPEELTKIGEIVERVKGIKGDDVPFVPVFVSCDPERDSPQVIKSYLKDFSDDFIGLTGPSDVIKSVAKGFRIYYRPTPTSPTGDYLIDHSIFFYLMGPDGKFICNFGRDSSVDLCTETILKEMEKVNYHKASDIKESK